MSLILSGSDGLSDVDGSAATPAIRGTDANTGIFFPAADTIAFSEGGVESMRLNSSGVLVATNDASISGLTVGKGTGSGAERTVVGNSALGFNTTGAFVTAVGSQAMYSNTTGSSNTGIGRAALLLNTTGNENTAVGRDSLYSNTTSNANTAVGYQALYASSTGTGVNTAIGYTAGSTITSGAFNVCVGYSTGNFGASLTTGSQNIYIGTNSGASSSTVSNELLISCINSQGKGGSTGFINANGGGVFQGNNSSTWSTTSDRRLKKNIVDNTDGLNKITAIQVRNFEYRLPEEVDEELKAGDAVQRTGVQLGVIAQEFQQVLPDCVKQETTGVLTVDTDNLTWYLVNAVKELKATVDAQAARIAALEAAP